MPAGRRRMRCADGFHLRRRTADLSEDRGTHRRPARTRPRALHLHERDVHAQKNARLPRRHLFAGNRAEAEKTARRKIDHRQGSRSHPQIRRRGEEKSRHPPDAMDVLECPCGRLGIHARSDCRARRRVQGMRRSHQDGENLRLSSRDEHHGLSRNRRGGNRGHVQVFEFARSGRPHDFARLRLRCGEERHGFAPRQRSEAIFPHARHDARRNLRRFRNGARRSPFSARRCIRNFSPANAS